MFAWLLLAACARPPDLVLVTMDTTRRDAIGVYGGPATPAIDALAADAIRYDRASTVVPLTIPAHASILTGRWPTSTGVHDNDDHVLAAGETTLAEALAAAGYDTGAAVGAHMLGHSWGFDQGFAWFDAPEAPERRGDEVVDAALSWLARDHQGAPIFLWVHLYDPHAPYDPPVPTPGGDPYLGEVAYLDQQIGRLADALRARDRWAQTGVVLVSDHGEGRGDHGEHEHGALTFSSTTGVPLIVRPPGGVPVRAESSPVSTVDVFPTLLSWASVGLPVGVDGTVLGGEDLGGGGPDGAARPVFVESHYLARHLGWSPLDGMVDDGGSWLRTTRVRRLDTDEHEILVPTPTAPAALVEHYAAPSTGPDGQAPATGGAPGDVPGTLAALESLGYLDSTVDRHVAVDPIDGIAGFEALKTAAAALAAGDDLAAAPAIEIARATDPDGPAVRLLAIGLRGRTDPAGALVDAQALLRDAPSARARATVGELLARTGQLRAAAPFLRDAARELPPDARQMGILGLALAEAHDPTATDWLQRALTANPDQPLLRAALGRISLDVGSPETAISWLQEEIARYAPSLDARKALVQALLATGRWPEALTELDTLDKLRAPDAGSAFARALALHHTGDDRGATRALALCLAAQPVPPICTRAAAGRW